MLKWFAREKKLPGWLAASFDGDALDYVYGQFVPSGKSAISAYGTRRVEGDKGHPEKIGRELRVERHQCVSMLRQGDYQMLLIEAPNVPQAELKSAMRWRIRSTASVVSV